MKGLELQAEASPRGARPSPAPAPGVFEQTLCQDTSPHHQQRRTEGGEDEEQRQSFHVLFKRKRCPEINSTRAWTGAGGRLDCIWE